MSPEKHNDIIVSVYELTVELLTEELGRKPHVFEVSSMLASVFGQSCGVALVAGCTDVQIKHLQMNSMTTARCIHEHYTDERVH